MDDDMKKLVLVAALFALIALVGCAQGGAQGSAQGDVQGNAQGAAQDSAQGAVRDSAGTANDSARSQTTAPLPPQTVTQETLPTDTGLSATDIGEATAKEIALNHAGYTADEAQWLKVERDYDDGRFEYEVEFYIGRIEYSYEIDAASGTVLSYEAEQDH
jgi:uncharacterized membrane protein YkoI